MDTAWILFFIAFIGSASVSFIFKKKRQRSQAPEVDERVLNLFQVYILRTLIGSGSVGVILLATFDIMGYQSLPLSYIWIYLLATMFALSICSFLAKKNRERGKFPLLIILTEQIDSICTISNCCVNNSTSYTRESSSKEGHSTNTTYPMTGHEPHIVDTYVTQSAIVLTSSSLADFLSSQSFCISSGLISWLFVRSRPADWSSALSRTENIVPGEPLFELPCARSKDAQEKNSDAPL